MLKKISEAIYLNFCLALIFYFVGLFVFVFGRVFHLSWPWIPESAVLELGLQIHLASLELGLQTRLATLVLGLQIHLASVVLESLITNPLLLPSWESLCTFNSLVVILKITRYSLNLSVPVHFIACSLDYHHALPALFQNSFKLFPLLLNFCPLIYCPQWGQNYIPKILVPLHCTVILHRVLTYTNYML